jgi:DNA-directed RNA polymerase subunit RPC12/RpoP
MSATKSMCVECGKDAMTFSPDDGWKCENCGHRLTGKRNYDKPSDVRRKKPMSDTHPGSHVDYTKLDGWDDLSEDEKVLFRMLLSADVGKLFTDGVAKLSDLETRINEAITSKRGDDE